MNEYANQVNIKDNSGNTISKKLKYTKYDNSDCPSLYKIYTIWKNLCESLEKLNKRTTNIPEAISEIAVSIINQYCFLNQKSITANKKKISTSFDCFDPIKGDKIQVKACSTEKDLTSFGPKSVFDKLIFVDFYDNGKRDGMFKVYDIPVNLISTYHVNSTQTLQNQASQKRRPRLCLKDIIKNNNINPKIYELTETSIEIK